MFSWHYSFLNKKKKNNIYLRSESTLFPWRNTYLSDSCTLQTSVHYSYKYDLCINKCVLHSDHVHRIYINKYKHNSKYTKAVCRGVMVSSGPHDPPILISSHSHLDGTISPLDVPPSHISLSCITYIHPYDGTRTVGQKHHKMDPNKSWI